MTFAVPSDLRFLFSLAERLGTTVAWLEANMTDKEYRFWRIYLNRVSYEIGEYGAKQYY